MLRDTFSEPRKVVQESQLPFSFSVKVSVRAKATMEINWQEGRGKGRREGWERGRGGREENKRKRMGREGRREKVKDGKTCCVCRT